MQYLMRDKVRAFLDINGGQGYTVWTRADVTAMDMYLYLAYGSDISYYTNALVTKLKERLHAEKRSLPSLAQEGLFNGFMPIFWKLSAEDRLKDLLQGEDAVSRKAILTQVLTEVRLNKDYEYFYKNGDFLITVAGLFNVFDGIIGGVLSADQVAGIIEQQEIKAGSEGNEAALYFYQIFKRSLREDPDPFYQNFFKLVRTPSAELFYHGYDDRYMTPFGHGHEVRTDIAKILPYLIKHHITLPELVRIHQERSVELVDALWESRAFWVAHEGDRDKPFVQREHFLDYIDESIESSSLRVVEHINNLHASTDEVRFASLQDASSRFLYILMIYAEEEIFTSTFNGIFDRLLVKMKNEGISGSQLIAQAGSAKFRVFIRLCAQFERLGEFLNTMPIQDQQALLNDFIGGMEKETTMLEDAVTVSDALTVIKTPAILSILQQKIKAEYARVEREGNEKGKMIYGLLAGTMSATALTDKAWFMNKHAQYKLADLSGIKASALFKGGVNTQVYSFYNDEDGEASYQSFIESYGGKKNWRIENKGNYVVLSSTKNDRTIRIYANKPQHEADGKAEIVSFFQRNRIVPQIVVHRGHSYHADATISNIGPGARLVFLGSCGGYRNLTGVLDKAPEAQIISTKGTGTMGVNDPLLVMMNEEMLSEGSLVWSNFWKKAEARLGGNEHFRKYVSPAKNTGVLFLKAYRDRMGKGRDNAEAGIQGLSFTENRFIHAADLEDGTFVGDIGGNDDIVGEKGVIDHHHMGPGFSASLLAFNHLIDGALPRGDRIKRIQTHVAPDLDAIGFVMVMNVARTGKIPVGFREFIDYVNAWDNARPQEDMQNSLGLLAQGLMSIADERAFSDALVRAGVRNIGEVPVDRKGEFFKDLKDAVGKMRVLVVSDFVTALLGAGYDATARKGVVAREDVPADMVDLFETAKAKVADEYSMFTEDFKASTRFEMNITSERPGPGVVRQPFAFTLDARTQHFPYVYALGLGGVIFKQVPAELNGSANPQYQEGLRGSKVVLAVNEELGVNVKGISDYLNDLEKRMRSAKGMNTLPAEGNSDRVFWKEAIKGRLVLTTEPTVMTAQELQDALREFSVPERSLIAKAGDNSENKDLGGIDLNDQYLDLQTRGEGIEFNLPPEWQGVDLDSIQGLEPSIISIVPVANPAAMVRDL